MKNRIEPSELNPKRILSDTDSIPENHKKTHWLVFTRYFIPFNASSKTEENISWLKDRADIFLKYCVPGMSAQAKFVRKWVVMIDMDYVDYFPMDAIDPALRERIELLDVKQMAEVSSATANVIDIYKNNIEQDHLIICTRLDNDDSISKDFFSVCARMKRSFFNYANNTIVSFTHGVQYDVVDNKKYMYLFSNNHFLCSLHRKQDYIKTHCLSMNHSHLFAGNFKVHCINTRYPVWMENVHSRNYSNTIQSGIPLPDSILLRFALPDEKKGKPVVSDGQGHGDWLTKFEDAISSSKAMKPTSFASVYASIFDRIRPIRILEIGIHEGASIRMWRDILGPDGFIAALDITEKSCAAARGVASEVYLGSQADNDLLERIGDDCGPFDLIIDDGSHRNPHMKSTLEKMMLNVRPGGAYLVEDMFTSYWPNYGGGYKDPSSFVEYTKETIDGMFAPFCTPKYIKHFGKIRLPQIPGDRVSEVVSEICVHEAGLTALYRR